MATKTSVGSGLWSAAETWDAGVPVDGDTVVIAAGHVVEFDVDQSGFANGIDGLTITGTLSLTRTAGTYYLKIKAAKTINGAGTFDCGTSESIIPFTAKHTITGGAGWYYDGASGLTMTVYAAEPIIKYVQLLNAEAIGSTVLEVGTDVTGDMWADGDTIRVTRRTTYGGTSIEVRTIAAGGIAAGSITITAGLSATKTTDDCIVLVTRNLSILGGYPKNFQSGKLTVAGGYHYINANWADNCNTVVITGGVFETANVFYYNNPNSRIEGGVFVNGKIFSYQTALISNAYAIGASYVADQSPYSVIKNVFATCFTYGVMASPYVFMDNCQFYGNHGVFSFSNGGRIYNTVIDTLNNLCPALSGVFTLVNCLLPRTIEHANYKTMAVEQYSESYDHDQVAGAYRAWTKGGITTKQAVTVPVGYTSAMQTVLESATSEGYWQKEVVVGAGASVNIEMNLRKTASMAYLPRCIIFNKSTTDPFSGGAGLHTFTMTNSIDTWESDLYTYTNSGSEDVTLVIRCQGMNATGNMYSAYKITVGGSGGAVSIVPFGGIRL